MITMEDLLIRRPATSIAARYSASVVGMTAKIDVEENSPIHWLDVE